MAMEPPAHVEFTNPPTLATPPGYTQVVAVNGGRTIYIAGQVALDAKTSGRRAITGIGIAPTSYSRKPSMFSAHVRDWNTSP